MSKPSRFPPDLRIPSPDRTSQPDSPNGATLSVVSVSSGSATGASLLVNGRSIPSGPPDVTQNVRRRGGCRPSPATGRAQ
jgi:hypothetical protein